MPLVPINGGWNQILLAILGSCFSAARKRLMALLEHEVLRASMAWTLPPGPQASWSGDPDSLYSAWMYFRTPTANRFLLKSTLPLPSRIQAPRAYILVCNVTLPSRVGVNARPQGMLSLSRSWRPPPRRLP